MKIHKWIYDNILFVITLFLLIFIPLYPKLPLLDVSNTWVYIRAEDLIVTFVFLLWIILLLLKKVTLKTPLTIPIMLFWIIGAISTIHGILLIFPTLDSVFPNVAFLSYLRRVEYISLFFVAYFGTRDKQHISYIAIVLAITLFLVAIYGIGQKFYGFPAYLTMNEEFAKGVPVQLSSLSRVSSTFGGHYDLAAYLVLIIPILTSMVFGFRNWLIKFFLLATVSLGFIVLFMTVSRVSFFVLLLSLVLMLTLHKKKLALLSIISFFLMGFVFLSFSTSLMQRFGNTIKEVDVLVDAKKGEAVGNIREVSSQDFKDKVIKIRFAQSKSEVDATIMNKKKKNVDSASDSAQTIDFSRLPPSIPLFVESNAPNGENLPQGTGYINLTLTPITKKIGQFFYQEAKESTEVLAVQGDFLIKKAVAYDLSFTTRFQGGWPKAISVFKKNILFGSGYSSAGLAVDNNYLRILGEVGLLGFISYFSIILIVVIYIKKLLPRVDTPLVRSFIFGFLAGVFGLALNAILIDVFEASKIAFVFWLLIGITLGTLRLYQKEEIDFYKEFKKAISSTLAVIIYLFIAVMVSFEAISNYYLVGDDFTWFRWIADCKNVSGELQRCQSIITTILSYFTEANGFFYRPGTKVYFLLMYSGFWLNQTVYHLVSIFLHFIVAMLLFLIFKKILKNFILAASASFLFVILSGYSEAVFWISSTGHLFNAMFILLGLLFFIIWKEKKKKVFIFLSFVSIVFSLLFHELGIIDPFLIALYGFVFEEELNFKGLFKKYYYALFFFPILPYLGLRILAKSHWLNGDYNYNLVNLPYNIVGNTIGYLMLAIFGPESLSLYQTFRNFSKENMLLMSTVSIIIIFIAIVTYKKFIKKMVKEDLKIMIFGLMFFIIALLPFLGLGNITSRYSYLASIGFILLFVFFLKKIYIYLSINGRDIAIASVILIIGIFSLLHIIQQQKIQRDWYEAGEKSKRFLISLNELYSDDWMKKRMHFYFVNVPIRFGDAWVFPVGLNDAVWFAFRNFKIDVYQSPSLGEAINAIEDPTRDKVFEFDENGKLIERKKPQNVSVIPAKK